MPLATLDNEARRAEIRARLSQFHPGVERRWGTLTPGGAICHVAGAYEMASGSLEVVQRTGLLQRSLVRFVALYIPAAWPKGISTAPELVEGAPRVQPGECDRDRERLLAAFEQFARMQQMEGRLHPIFGPLSYWEWMRWGYLHADHHLRQFGL